MAASDESATGRSFESRAHELLKRWTAERELSASPDEAEAARSYLERLHIHVLPTDDGRFVLKESGRVVSRIEVIVLGLRQLAARRPRIAP